MFALLSRWPRSTDLFFYIAHFPTWWWILNSIAILLNAEQLKKSDLSLSSLRPSGIKFKHWKIEDNFDIWFRWRLGVKWYRLGRFIKESSQFTNGVSKHICDAKSVGQVHNKYCSQFQGKDSQSSLRILLMYKFVLNQWDINPTTTLKKMYLYL